MADFNGAADGGQDLTTDTLWAAAGDIVYATANDTATILSVGTNGDILQLAAGIPGWTSSPTIGSTSWCNANHAHAGDSSGGTIAITAATGTLTVGNGGTGATCLTNGGVLLGSGTGAITAMSVLAAGAIIKGDGTTDPVALTRGSACQVLTTKCCDVSWEDAGGGGVAACADTTWTGDHILDHVADNTGGNVYARVKIENTNAITANTGTTGRITSLWVSEPNVTESGGTVTNTSAIFVEGPASEGCNNWAINVDSGLIRAQGIRNTNGSAACPSYTFGDDPNLGIYRIGADALGIAGACAEMIRFDMYGGGNRLAIGCNDPGGGGTVGLWINQAGYDDTVIQLKSTDISHAMTGHVGASTYGAFKKVNTAGPGDQSAGGGLEIAGYKKADCSNSHALVLAGRIGHTSVDGSHTAGGYGVIVVTGAISDGGSSTTALAADDNLFSVDNFGTTMFHVTSCGKLYANGGDGSTDMVVLFDNYCDAQLTRAFTQVIDSSSTDRSGLISNHWDDFVAYNEQTLIDLDLLGGPRIGVERGKRGLVNYTGMVHLHSGAIWQLHSKMNDQAEELTALRGQVQALTEGK